MPGHSLDDLRAANRRAVTSALGDMGPMSRADLVRATGLSATTISSLVTDLIESGAVTETDDRARPHKGGSGRPPVLVALAVRPGQVAGIDIGHHHVRVAVADRAGTILAEDQTETDTDSHGERTLEQAFSLLDRVVSSTGGRVPDLVWAGLCVPGPIDRRSSRLDGGVLPGWRGMAPGVEMQERLGIPVAVDNDANLGAIAEHAVGVGRDVDDLVYLAGEVGVGCGVIVGGRLVRGASGFTGEIGHAPLNPRLEVCGCGRVGCWETQVGLGVLLAGCARGPEDPILDGDADIDARLDEIGARAAAGDPATLATLERVGIALGLGASVLVNIVNPGALVLGGYFAALAEHLRPYVVHTLHERVVAPDAGGVDVRASELGFTAASRGGAVVALQQVFADPTRVPLARAAADG